jgi:cytochrome c-type biogenesis protein CcmH/NrfG
LPSLASAAERRRLLEEAWSLLRAQRFDEARGAFSRLVERKPPPAGALLGLAQVAFQEHNYAEASKRAREGVRAGAGVEAYVVLGDAHFRLQQYAEARKAYAEALRLEPEHEAARRAMVIVERQLH